MTLQAILLITTSYPDDGDGSEAAGSFVADVAERLAQRMPVRVVAPGRWQSAPRPGADIAVWRFASPGKALSLLSPLRPGDWPAIVRTLYSLRRQTLAAAADGQVAHALALWVLPSGWAARELHRLGIPYSVWALGSDIWSLGRIAPVRRLLRIVAKGAYQRFADGFQLADDAAQLCAAPFVFLPSTRALCTQRTQALATAPPYRLLFLGRWHPNKGIDLLLEALALLEERDWQRIGEVEIFGGGPLEHIVKDGVARLVAQGRPVRLGGFLDKAAATDALARADFVLIPSRIESIPVVFSDAMKMRAPVVSAPVGDLPALLQRYAVGVCATSVEPPDFAAAIRQALQRAPAEFEDGFTQANSDFDLDAIAERIAALADESARRAGMAEPT